MLVSYSSDASRKCRGQFQKEGEAGGHVWVTGKDKRVVLLTRPENSIEPLSKCESPLPLLSSGLLQEAIIQKGSGAKEQEGVCFFFFSFPWRWGKESTGKSNFHNFPLKQALKSRLTPPSSCRKLDISNAKWWRGHHPELLCRKKWKDRNWRVRDDLYSLEAGWPLK